MRFVLQHCDSSLKFATTPRNFSQITPYLAVGDAEQATLNIIYKDVQVELNLAKQLNFFDLDAESPVKLVVFKQNLKENQFSQSGRTYASKDEIAPFLVSEEQTATFAGEPIAQRKDIEVFPVDELKTLQFLPFIHANTQQVLGHRGMGANHRAKEPNLTLYPENSVKSFVQAQKLVDGFEFDLILLKDGNLIVNHDFERNNVKLVDQDLKFVKDTFPLVPTFEELLSITLPDKIMDIEIKYCENLFGRRLRILQAISSCLQGKQLKYFISSFDFVLIAVLKLIGHDAAYINKGYQLFYKDVARNFFKAVQLADKYGIDKMVVPFQFAPFINKAARQFYVYGNNHSKCKGSSDVVNIVDGVLDDNCSVPK